jgi:hypothetical protein
VKVMGSKPSYFLKSFLPSLLYHEVPESWKKLLNVLGFSFLLGQMKKFTLSLQVDV